MAVACLPACVRDIALKLTSVYETSSQDLTWDACVNLPDSHGYSVGIVQFTTGTGSAQSVISKYEQSLSSDSKNSSSPFKSFDPILNSLVQAAESSGGSPQGDISGLSGFCDAWKQACGDPAFKDAQLQVLDQLYWTPSQNTAKSYSLSLPVSLAQIFDSTIQLGAQGTRELLQQVQAKQNGNPESGQELTWISAFLDARREKLVAMGGAYAPTVTRVDSFKYIVNHGDGEFEGNKVDALNNDGNVMTVECDAGVVNGSYGGAGIPSTGGSDAIGGASNSGFKASGSFQAVAGSIIVCFLFWLL